MTTVIDPECDALTRKATDITLLLTAALCELDGLPSDPSRTKLGRHLFDARAIAQAWIDQGQMTPTDGWDVT